MSSCKANVGVPPEVVERHAASVQEKLYTQADLDFFSANADEYFEMANRLREALTAIRDNAVAWHGDDAAKGRALKVIACWAQEALDG